MITLEKMIFLKAMPLFKHIKDDVLLVVAANVEEQLSQKGEIIIQKGALDNTMYMIIKGKVSIHDEDREITQLGAGEIVGELSALVPYKRIASVTTLEESLFLKINHAALFQLMGMNLGVVEGIIEVLVERLRHVEMKTNVAK